jgi:hypothetical protein
MTVRAVLYAEGSRESAGSDRAHLYLEPGALLAEDALGAGHLLVRKAMVRALRVPEPAIQFEAPLLTRGRRPRGAQLRHRATLRQLLRWPDPSKRPDCVVFLVDQDGDATRKSALEEAASDLPVPHVFGIPVPEFEAWLIADVQAVRSATSLAEFDVAEPVESLAPQEAKRRLTRFTSDD